MPKPRENEKESEFIDRCIADLVGEEDRKPDQASAICHSIWDEHTRKHLQEVLVNTLFLDFMKGKCKRRKPKGGK